MSLRKAYIIFIRHGDAEVPLNTYPDHHQMGLSALGRQQADRVAQSLATFHIDRLVASPLPRATQTAAALVKGRSLQIETDPGLEERVVRPLYGKHYEEIALEHGRDLVDALRRGDCDDVTFLGVEDLSVYAARTRAALDAICSTTRGVTVVVAHGGPHEWYLKSLLFGSFQHRQRWFALGKCRATVFVSAAGDANPFRIMGINLDVADARQLIEAETLGPKAL